MIGWLVRLAGALLSLVGFCCPYFSAVAEDDGTEWRVRYSEASNLPPEAADRLVAADKESITIKRNVDRPPDNNARIIGGVAVELKNFPDVVRIRFTNPRGRHTCTGVLLSSDAILTAGHCGCGRNYEASIQTSPVETGVEQAFKPLTLAGGPILFPGYRCYGPDGSGIGRDLALLRVVPLEAVDGGGFNFRGTRVLIQFPTIRSTIRVLSDEGLRSLFIVGFGTTESGTVAQNLQGANIGLISRHCVKGHVFLSFCASFREFAMGRPRASGVPADSCGGDSGAPAYRMDTDIELDTTASVTTSVSQRTLVGIVSRALAGVVHPYKDYCGGGGIYTAVGTRPVLEWLRTQNVNFAYDENPNYDPERG
ncbi:trypsin-like serine protease [Sinorhizobium psoraleae]|uniref:Trypsin-like serine protease n=1 Tax=Sinorhizobium psoraleae TaxID=520838 RepID=A0ABT4K9U2_9HYPH|nr:trypsin-like serine protease [Sinorhizobium psoraleae]MCZ4088718.1 trypsin-like serine protease [Sinorhizobium psoraleae]